MTKIKFCGLKTPEDAAAVRNVGADYAGFVFVPGSRRYLSLEEAAEIRKKLGPSIEAVGVFADADCEMAAEYLLRGIVDIAQLHGNEDSAYIRKLKKMTGRQVIRAFRVDGSFDLREAQCSPADYILFDSGIGGTGRMFDWTKILPVTRPYFLAGGLDADCVAAAIRMLRPFAVDVSSGIETGGKKDAVKMAAFAAAVRKEERL